MNRTTECLTYLGLLPFIAALGMSFYGLNVGHITGPLLFISYSAIILCFIAGALWGQSSHHKHTRHSVALLMTNIWALAAWVCLLVFISSSKFLAIALLAIGFIHLLLLELKIKSIDASPEYYTMRKRISFFVVLCHLIMLILLSQK